jgi:hypothetical protein
MVSRKTKFRKSTAYHEAGHAVAATAIGLGVKTVSIIPDPTRGTIDWVSGGRVTVKRCEYGDRDIIVLFAGGAAQRRHAPTSVRRFSAEGDFNKMKMLIDVGRVEDAMRKKRQNWLKDETDRLINSQWTAIEAVANRLMQTGELTGTEVSAIFRHCGGKRWKFPVDHHLYEPASQEELFSVR